MKKFKKGELIVCIDVRGNSFADSLTIGKSYIMDRYSSTSIDCIHIRDDFGFDRGYFEYRFISLREYRLNNRKEKLEKINVYEEGR